jgi:isopenicillin N synthase-like dioxygenase
MSCWFDEMKLFFDLDLETKMKYPYEADELGPMGFRINKDSTEKFDYNNARMGNHLWPKDLPNFKASALQSIDIADKLTLRILRKFDDILGTGNTLVDAHIRSNNSTRVIHYPSIIEEKQMRMGEHSDFGTITLLWQVNDVPGLQVQDLDGAWHSVPCVQDSVVVNIGDLIHRWTNDYFKSTKHSVINSHIHLNRYSMPHFVDPPPGTIVRNLIAAKDKYEPIESKEYLMWRLAQSY